MGFYLGAVLSFCLCAVVGPNAVPVTIVFGVFMVAFGDSSSLELLAMRKLRGSTWMGIGLLFGGPYGAVFGPTLFGS